jgi:hypothetical protein
MPATSQKNLPLSGIAADMGFGGAQLAQQLQDETEDERRRRLMGMGSPGRPTGGGILARANPVLSPATLSLFGGMGGYTR